MIPQDGNFLPNLLHLTIIFSKRRSGFKTAEQNGAKLKTRHDYIRRRSDLIPIRLYSFRSHLDPVSRTQIPAIFSVYRGVDPRLFSPPQHIWHPQYTGRHSGPTRDIVPQRKVITGEWTLFTYEGIPGPLPPWRHLNYIHHIGRYK
jgi:hypothetical protein